jgi:hypothetical protein
MSERITQEEQIDWDEIYAIIGDGSIDDCLGAECGQSCCGLKPIFGLRESLLAFKTRFLGEGEYEYQNGIFSPNLEDIDVKVVLPPAISDSRSEFAYVVNGCMNEEGECKLKNRKPFNCRIFPYGLDADYPVSHRCPQIHSIYRDKDFRERVLHVRKRLGLMDNDKWIANARRVVSEVEGQRRA